MKRSLVITGFLMVAFSVGTFSFTEVPKVSFGTLLSVSDIPSEEIATPVVVPTKKNIIFTGDVLLARYVEKLIGIFGVEYPFLKMSLSTENSFVFGNFEAAIPKKHVPTPDFTFSFSVASTSLAVLDDFGFTNMSLSNNHAFDFGTAGYENTVTVLNARGIGTVGIPDNTPNKSISYSTVQDKKIAIIALNATFEELIKSEIEDIFTEATQNSDIQIVYIHWGVEYKPMHSQNQEDIAKLLVQQGADVIIGHHPHVVQDVGFIDGVPVFYSLGNFVFDQYFSDEVQTGLLLKFSFTDTAINTTLIPVSSMGSLSSPYLMNKKESTVFLENLARKSDESLQGMIISNTLTFQVGQ